MPYHVANLELQGRPVMVVLCEACAGASAFDARVGGRHYRFRVDGKYNGTHILKDIDTGSHWTPFDGSAAHGPMKGAKLEQLPLQQCTWAEWREMYADTRVPDGNGRAISGFLVGRRLRYVSSGIEKWYGWATSHPGTELFEPKNFRGRT